jgi:dihydrofolate reductase
VPVDGILLRRKLAEGFIAYWADFVADLIIHDLLDDLHLVVNPVAIGQGLPIFARAGRRDRNRRFRYAPYIELFLSA